MLLKAVVNFNGLLDTKSSLIDESLVKIHECLFSMKRENQWIPENLAPEGIETGCFRDSNYSRQDALDEVVNKIHEGVVLLVLLKDQRFHLIRTHRDEQDGTLRFLEVLPHGAVHEITEDKLTVVGIVEAIVLNTTDADMLCGAVQEVSFSPGQKARQKAKREKKMKTKV